MVFRKVKNFKLMKVGKTQNTLEIDEKTIKEAVAHQVFDNAPIVFNENQIFKDYREKDVVKNFIQQKAVGVVISNTVVFDGLYVTGDVMLQKEFANRTCYDNWCITIDRSMPYFNYNSCELFSKEE